MNAPPRIITIVQTGGNSFSVHEGERFCDRLCWDEMLGTIAELTHPAIGGARYRMLDADQFLEEQQRHIDAMNRNKQQGEIS